MAMQNMPGCCCSPCRQCTKSARQYIADISGFINSPTCTGCLDLNGAWVLAAFAQTGTSTGGVCFYEVQTSIQMCSRPDWFIWTFQNLTYYIRTEFGGTTSRELELRIKREAWPGGEVFVSTLTYWQQTGHSKDCMAPIVFTYEDVTMTQDFTWLPGNTPSAPRPAAGEYWPEHTPGWICDLHGVEIEITPA